MPGALRTDGEDPVHLFASPTDSRTATTGFFPVVFVFLVPEEKPNRMQTSSSGTADEKILGKRDSKTVPLKPRSGPNSSIGPAKLQHLHPSRHYLV